VIEGKTKTLSCTFETTSLSPDLFWYKQQGNGNPLFMMRRDKFSPGETATEFKERFHAILDITAKSVPLTIKKLQLSDSAVYYCALRPTVTTGYAAPLQKLCVHVFLCQGVSPEVGSKRRRFVYFKPRHRTLSRSCNLKVKQKESKTQVVSPRRVTIQKRTGRRRR
uniref:Ig-like domain-containing protein n=1 Tax=Esox lucius TaxID=8010 RepID=A0A6Q2WSU2_ESOLU